MKNAEDISGYRYSGASQSHSHAYLMPTVRAELHSLRARLDGRSARLFDLGCGNGSVASVLAADGWEVTGVDPSLEGIVEAKKAFPDLRLAHGSAYDDLAALYGRFPIVISLEVVEHVYAPRDYARTLFDLVEPGGKVIVSTPYHGYLKNLALAVLGKMDVHFTVLWDHGHIKFWSIPTLDDPLDKCWFPQHPLSSCRSDPCPRQVNDCSCGEAALLTSECKPSLESAWMLFGATACPMTHHLNLVARKSSHCR